MCVINNAVEILKLHISYLLAELLHVITPMTYTNKYIRNYRKFFSDQ